MERRHTPRICESFPVRIRALDQAGQRFDDETRVENISAGGIYLRLPRMVRQGDDLFIVIRMSTESPRAGSGARVAAKGVVTRVEDRPDGQFGVAVAFRQHRFL